MELQVLFEAQEKLGWTAFCVGRISNQWAQYTTATDSHNNPKRWTHLLIQKLCLTIWQMWDHRNSVLHDPSGRVQQQEHLQINAQIRVQYMIGSLDLHSEDLALLLTTVNILCNKSIERKKLWLRSVEIARENSLHSRIPPSDTGQDSRTQPEHHPPTGLTRWLNG